MTNDQTNKIKDIFQSESDYLGGLITKEDYFSQSGAFLECSQPFGEGGEFVCEVCLAKYLGLEPSEVFDFSVQVGRTSEPSFAALPEGYEDEFKEVEG